VSEQEAFGEDIMRARWRPVRIGTEHEKADREYNTRLAEALLSSRQADDFAIAVDLVDWRLTPRAPVLAGEKWPLLSNSPLVPDWCAPVAEQEHQVARDIVAAGLRRTVATMLAEMGITLDVVAA
jgi:hypothetical protein